MGQEFDVPDAIRQNRLSTLWKLEAAMNRPNDSSHTDDLNDKLRQREIAVFDPRRSLRRLDRE